MTEINLNDVTEGLRASKDALDIVKGVLGLLPKGEDADKAASQIEVAEKAFRASEAQLAKALGYNLCQCIFPPETMLWKQDRQVYACDACGNQINPQPAVQRKESSWAGRRHGR